MALDFPASPTLNQTYTDSGKTWTWNGSGWALTAPTLTVDASAGDVLSLTSNQISADDAGSDKLVFWDDSAGKLTYLTVGNNLTITGTTIAASGGGGALSDSFLLMGA